MTSVDIAGIVGKYFKMLFERLDLIEDRLLEIEKKLKK
jgi:hypothetical protein